MILSHKTLHIRTAIPHHVSCPHCGEEIQDWHTEWYTPVDLKRIYQGEANMDCPVCRNPVSYTRGVLKRPDPVLKDKVPTLTRSPAQARKWAQYIQTDLQNYYENDPNGQYYQNYFQSPTHPQTQSTPTPK
jgi:phage terminase large subunit GpA-like protein